MRKENVTILATKKKNNNFHARFSAKLRIYNYIIINRLSEPALEKNRCWHIIKKLNLHIMKKGAKKLIGTNDFSTFRASSCRAKSPIKTMKLVKIKSLKRFESVMKSRQRSLCAPLAPPEGLYLSKIIY